MNSIHFSTRKGAPEKSIVHCFDAAPFTSEAPTSQQVVDEYLNVFRNVSKVVFAAVQSEVDSACQHWDIQAPTEGSFTGVLDPNMQLQNPVLILGNEVSSSQEGSEVDCRLTKSAGGPTFASLSSSSFGGIVGEERATSL